MQRSLTDWLFLFVGAALLLVAMYGLWAESVPFMGRRRLVLLNLDVDGMLYWFVEGFYSLGGTLLMMFGLKNEQ